MSAKQIEVQMLLKLPASRTVPGPKMWVSCAEARRLVRQGTAKLTGNERAIADMGSAEVR